jgi:hypothetical protein
LYPDTVQKTKLAGVIVQMLDAVMDPPQAQAKEPEVKEATLINDPDAGVQIRPAGGMGTWTEDSLKKNLAEKFAQMLTLLKTGQYDKIHDILKQGSWVANMVRALAEYQAFQAQQGQRPIARGAEIDITDYVDERRASQ